MADFKVITDTSADLPEELIKSRDIITVPFYVMTDGSYVHQHIDITDEAFYEWMVTNPGRFPKSSCPSAPDFASVFRECAQAGEKIICICITTKFSSSYQSACIARQMVCDELPDAAIEVIDSTVNTVLQGQFVEDACDLRDAGVSFDAAVKKLAELKSTGRIFFTVGSIEYLQIGGRIGKLAGKVSSALNIRPIIRLSEGEIHPEGVARGRKKSLDKVISAAESYIAERFGDDRKALSITVGYGYDLEEAESFKERVVEMLTRYGFSHECPIRRIGAVIGVHTGPYPLGVGVISKAIV